MLLLSLRTELRLLALYELTVNTSYRACVLWDKGALHICPQCILFLLQTFRSSEPFLFVPLARSVVLPVGTRRHWQDGQNMTKGTHLPPAFTCTEEGYIWLVDWSVAWLV